MGTIVEFENSQGRKFFINPELVVSLYESNKQVDPTIIAMFNGQHFCARQPLREVIAKLRLE